MTSQIKKIYSCRFRGIELSCVQGDILVVETDAISSLCDPNFALTNGLGKVIKTAVGRGFSAAVADSRCNQNSMAISVPIYSEGVQANFIILVPVRNTDMGSIDRLYIAIIQKAIELKIHSLTMPLLGTGGLGLNFDAAANFMKSALNHFANFGGLQKFQIIDPTESRTHSIRNYMASQLQLARDEEAGPSTSRVTRSATASIGNRRGVQTHSTNTDDSRSSYRAIGSGSSTSPIEIVTRAVVSGNGPRQTGNSRGRTHNFTPNATSTPHENSPLNVNRRIRPARGGVAQVDISITLSSENSSVRIPSSSSDASTDTGGADNTNEGNESEANDDEEMSNFDSSDSDIMDSDDSDEEISDESDEDVVVLSDDNGGTAEIGNGLDKEQESQFWSVVSTAELNVPSQENKPSSSANLNSSMRNPNVRLDDSTMPCSICLTDMRNAEESMNTDSDDVVVQLSLCAHMFHRECISAAFKVKRQCPLCMLFYGDTVGYQPKDATMKVQEEPGKVPGHRDAKGWYKITYEVPGGIQMEGHIRPGVPYPATIRFAYLPNNKEGTQVLKLLQLAFRRRLIFTIGDSVTTGRKNVVTWNGIHHKTMKEGGPDRYGYPDPSYLTRVKEELIQAGVRADQL